MLVLRCLKSPPKPSARYPSAQRSFGCNEPVDGCIKLCKHLLAHLREAAVQDIFANPAKNIDPHVQHSIRRAGDNGEATKTALCIHGERDQPTCSQRSMAIPHPCCTAM
jgi:hypothetical protein